MPVTEVQRKDKSPLLNRGLSFVPTAAEADATEILRDLHKFTIQVKKKYTEWSTPTQTIQTR